MCTAIHDGALFGRTLDSERGFGERVLYTPRGFSWHFQGVREFTSRYAILGMGIHYGENALYFDAMNERGVAVAALNFPQSAVYLPAGEGYGNLPSFALIPYLLSLCHSAEEGAERLSWVNLTPDSLSEELPASPLHFLLADRKHCYTVEPLGEGLKVTENPVGVLANEPDFAYHMTHLADFSPLSPLPPHNSLCDGVALPLYSRGLGAFGLPGDFSSASRFVRGVYLKYHTERSAEISPVLRFFHIMDNLAVPRGAVRLSDGQAVSTLYTSCADLEAGVYYVTTERDRSVKGYAFGDFEKTRLTAEG